VRGGQRLLRNPITHIVARLLGMRTRPAPLYVSAEKLTDTVLDWLVETHDPFFTWAHYMDVHWPYHREETLTRPREIARAWQDLAHLHAANWKGATISAAEKAHYIQLYEEAIQYTDAQIGRLLDYLDHTGKAKNTIVIVVADHGEELLDHGRWGHWEDNLYDEILRVPLIMTIPGVITGEKVITHQMRTLDIMPTILDLCDCPLPEKIEGQSVLPLVNGHPAAYDVEVSISEMWRAEWHIIAVRSEAYKYIWNSRQPDRPFLFNLQIDPAETVNIARQEPEIVAEMHTYVQAHQQKVARTMPAEAFAAPDLDDEIVSRLRDLGYLE